MPRPQECPTPHKHVHRSKPAAYKALQALRADRDLGPDWNVYQCRCGNWHIGHKPGSLQDRARRALKKGDH